MSTDSLSRALVSIRIDIAMIGAGQAGLSSAYHLRRIGLRPDEDFVTLDQSPGPGGAWQFRWPSLTLAAANRVHDLPGMKLEDVVDPDSSRDVQASIAMPRYFGAYEKAFELRVRRPVKVKVIGTANLRSIELIRNNKIVHSHRPSGSRAAFEYRDLEPPAGESYYYLRVVQEDGNMAWSSPVWIVR